MVAHQFSQQAAPGGQSHPLVFAGDNVSLAGQIDYPAVVPPEAGYPLLFVLPHAGCIGLKGHIQYARIGVEAGHAVFRWDKRGRGRSGSGGHGSPRMDALYAYKAALNQPDINRDKVVILAQNDSSITLGEMFEEFSNVQAPRGILVVGNMLEPDKVHQLAAPALFITGDGDWNSWQHYAQKAAKVHSAHYNYEAAYYVADNADRRLLDNRNQSFHSGASLTIINWLETL